MTAKVLTIREYLSFVEETDRLPSNELSPVLHGLFGEVGGLMAAAKKIKREPDSFTGFNSVVVEEFGDAFWYLCCLAKRLEIDIESVFIAVVSESQSEPEVLIGTEYSPVSLMYKNQVERDFDEVLIDLGQLTGNFLNPEFIKEESLEKLTSFLKTFFSALHILNLNFSQVIQWNIKKISSRFIMPKYSDLPTFDDNFIEFERLPDEFEIEFVQRTETQQAMRWNGVFIGDPLTDSIKDQDGYRFHDVFHFAFAAILHWSPTFRALIKHKRKSDSEVDKTQDGGRAIVVEEGLSAWIFTIAKENKYFEGKNNLTFDMLKNVGQFVKGFEVEKCPLILWEKAILDGYEVFRKVEANSGGVVICSRKDRAITYREKI
jgi:NTP pyrophosphatase (non-canonical NTP hydrolase)